MRKVFVILLTICLCLLSGCKPALPGATIYISNETGDEPDSYELNVLFENSKGPDARAFHMKNIAPNVATAQKAIVLENMPKMEYRAEVIAYKQGEKMGEGSSSFFTGTNDANVTVYVRHWEKPSASFSKSFNFVPGQVDAIKLTITNADGKIVETTTYPDLADKNTLSITNHKILTEYVNATLTWSIIKGDNVIKTFADTIESIEEKKTYELETADINLSVDLQDISYRLSDGSLNPDMEYVFDKGSIAIEMSEDLKSTCKDFKYTVYRNGNQVHTTSAPIETRTLQFDAEPSSTYQVVVTPISNDGVELKAFAKTVEVKTNTPLERVALFKEGNELTGNVELNLGESLSLEIRKFPENYTRWNDEEKLIADNSLSISKDGSLFILQAIDTIASSLRYQEGNYNLDVPALSFNISLKAPKLSISTQGSAITLTWEEIPSNTELKLMKSVNGEEAKEHPIKGHNSTTDSTPKNTEVSYYLALSFKGETVTSNTVLHKTGDSHIVNITIPRIEDMDIKFTPSLSIDTVLDYSDEMSFRLDSLENNITDVYWFVNNREIKHTKLENGVLADEFKFKANDQKIELNHGYGVVQQEVVIAVKTTQGSVHSKNITLNLNMESLI